MLDFRLDSLVEFIILPGCGLLEDGLGGISIILSGLHLSLLGQTDANALFIPLQPFLALALGFGGWLAVLAGGGE